jgi:NAD(P)-dependent dehydrogenase (short-subunit alcohol dehydrogenase family)
MGLETARQARAEGAELILAARNEERLAAAATEVGARSWKSFDATDAGSLKQFFDGLGEPIDHVMVTAGGPHYGSVLDMELGEIRSGLSDHLMQVIAVARSAAAAVRPGGALLFMTSAGARRPGIGMGVVSTVTAALPALAANLALELAPIRVNLIAAGFVDSPLSASVLGDSLEKRREQLRKTLPIRRVIEPGDVAALAVHLMVNTAITGTTVDIDGGQQLVE